MKKIAALLFSVSACTSMEVDAQREYRCTLTQATPRANYSDDREMARAIRNGQVEIAFDLSIAGDAMYISSTKGRSRYQIRPDASSHYTRAFQDMTDREVGRMIALDRQQHPKGPFYYVAIQTKYNDGTDQLHGGLCSPLGQNKTSTSGNAAEQKRLADEWLYRMNSAMDAAMPGWRQINEDPKFIAWTKEPSSTAGKTRQEILQGLWNAGDAKRLAAMFRDYLKAK